jgi:hypothetical protein
MLPNYRQCDAFWADKLCTVIILAFLMPIQGSLHNLAEKWREERSLKENGWRWRIFQLIVFLHSISNQHMG